MENLLRIRSYQYDRSVAGICYLSGGLCFELLDTPSKFLAKDMPQFKSLLKNFRLIKRNHYKSTSRYLDCYMALHMWNDSVQKH
jgi:hypothetical protein